MQSTVSSKGQVTLPKPLRDRLGIRTGTVLEFRERDGAIVVRKKMTEDPVAAAYGLLAENGRRTDDVIAALRGEEPPA